MNMLNDFTGKAVLITGGTKGIGLATGLAFGRCGAACTLTHKWGSANEGQIVRAFEEVGARRPVIVEADAREDEDTATLLERMAGDFDHIEVFVSGAAFAQVVQGVDDYTRRSFMQSLDYTTWPLVAYLQQIRNVFGRYPRYIIGMSSGGPDDFHAFYDIVAASKGALEVLCRYLAYRLADQDVRVNVVRARFARTDSLWATCGTEFGPFVDAYDPSLFVDVEDIANTVLALCSGLMDAVTGQILMVDHGTAFSDNLMGLFDRHRDASRQEGCEP
jgi:NAD(P)-dependent dehydrogenase (short-subunit alcohol dehydrogenase family)